MICLMESSKFFFELSPNLPGPVINAVAVQDSDYGLLFIVSH
jgi:hypothetical protein